jgi:hypothetical protein
MVSLLFFLWQRQEESELFLTLVKTDRFHSLPSAALPLQPLECAVTGDK